MKKESIKITMTVDQLMLLMSSMTFSAIMKDDDETSDLRRKIGMSLYCLRDSSRIRTEFDFTEEIKND